MTGCVRRAITAALASMLSRDPVTGWLNHEDPPPPPPTKEQ